MLHLQVLCNWLILIITVFSQFWNCNFYQHTLSFWVFFCLNVTYIVWYCGNLVMFLCCTFPGRRTSYMISTVVSQMPSGRMFANSWWRWGSQWRRWSTSRYVHVKGRQQFLILLLVSARAAVLRCTSRNLDVASLVSECKNSNSRHVIIRTLYSVMWCAWLLPFPSSRQHLCTDDFLTWLSII